MSLGPGTRLGPYEIVPAIGAGGMGEVYRGRDSRLGRDVAIKILPSTLTSDPDHPDRRAIGARASVSICGVSRRSTLLNVLEDSDANPAITVILNSPSLLPN
jgi:serine/threonine protein kinase